MRKIAFAFFIAAVCTVCFGGCKKSSETDLVHATMRPWFDKNCKSCHGSGGSNRSAWLYNPDNYDGSIKKHISHIFKEVYINKSMPPSGLSQAEM